MVGGFLLGSLLGCVVWLCPVPVLGAPREVLYDQLISTTAQRHGLEPALVKAVIRCESRFDPSAQSPRGAQGLMQLMPATQTLLGVTNAFDPEHNVAGGVRYLAMLKQTFGGNVSLILAGYNAGPQAVIEAGYTIPPFPETQDYVRCVLSAHSHYSQHGLQQPFPGVQASLRHGVRPPFPGIQAALGRPEERGTLVVQPLRFSSQVARLGQQLTLHLEAVNTGRRPSHGVVMLNYPEHLVSYMALHTAGGETTVQLSAAQAGQPAPAAQATAYQLLWSHWPAWQPGERRTAVIALVPRLPQDITLHLSVVLDHAAKAAIPQRWGSVVRIPFQTTTW
jgi:hypothetical protein